MLKPLLFVITLVNCQFIHLYQETNDHLFLGARTGSTSLLGSLTDYMLKLWTIKDAELMSKDAD